MPLNLPTRKPRSRKPLSTAHLTQQQIDEKTASILAALLGDPAKRARRR